MRKPRFAVSVALSIGAFAAIAALAQPPAPPSPHTPPAPPAATAPTPPAAPTTTPAPDTNPAVRTPSIANQSPFSDALGALTADEKRYFQMDASLSDPFFEGRAPGSRGNALVCDYVEFAFKRLDLAPGFPSVERAADGTEVITPHGSFRQAFSAGFDQKATEQEAHLVVAVGPGEFRAGPSLKPGKDFNVLAMSGTGAAEGSVVFAGYAIENGPGDYTTFAEKDTLEGKIALVLRFEPLNDAGKSRLTESGSWSPAGRESAKLAALAKRKPAGVIFVNPPGVTDARADRLEDVRTIRGSGTMEFPVVMFSREQGETLAKASGATLMALRREADKAGGIRSLSTSHVAIKAKVERVPVEADNVAAMLPGKGALAEEFIVIGAHMDHVGYGAFGSRAGRTAAGRLHPGADDNASGTAGLILAAEKLVEAYRQLPEQAQARSVMFVGFNAEESGLVGSRAFVRKSPIAASKVYAMLNMDMIGRVRMNKLDMYGVGTAEGFEALVSPMMARSGLNVRIKNLEGTLFGGSGPSDHASFYGVGIPVLHFFTGLSPEYHMPEDFFWTINPEGAVKVVNLVVDIATSLALRSEPLVFTSSRGAGLMYEDPSAAPAPGGPDKPQAGAAPKAPANPPNPHAAPMVKIEPGPGAEPPADDQPKPVRVRFGIAPGDYSDEKPGVLVGEVFPDTPAAKAGLKAGDRITKWNDKVLGSVESWMPLLRNAKPGDVVELTYVRDGKEATTKCTLTGRDAPEK